METVLKYTLYIQTISLIIISLFVILFSNQIFYLFPRFLIIFSVSIMLEYILTNYFYKASQFNIQNISFALIIFLITDPKIGIFLPIFLTIVAHLSFYFIKYKDKPIFNTVVLSIFIFSLFGVKITWWGIDSGTFIVLLMMFLGILINYFNRTLFLSALYFLTVFTLSNIFSFNPLFSLKQFLVPGFLFFGLYLIHNNLELKPNNLRLNIIYIALASFLALTVPKFAIFTDPLITSLVFTDLIFFLTNKFLMNRSLTI